jgi:predicted nuclease with RNAse H fold
MSACESHLYLGIDVQAAARGCPYAVLNAAGDSVEAGWASGSAEEVVRSLNNLVRRLVETRGALVAVGIDAPRTYLRTPREWYWNGSTAHWRARRPVELGNGRHCEVVITAHRLANPQWSPHCPPFREWMQLGFSLFAALEKRASRVESNRIVVYEVFPSASYTLLKNGHSLMIGVQLNSFAPGPKDMLDAYVAAATVREFAQGRGCVVGGGDGLGGIILPCPIPDPIEEVLRWPEETGVLGNGALGWNDRVLSRRQSVDEG